MAFGKGGAGLRELPALLVGGVLGDLTDGQLLERFESGRGEIRERAFALLVERHGPLVLRVCRGILRDPHDAQDAFQATFLLLVAKARGLWVRDSLAPWLHQVACRTAKGARTAAARRRRLERNGAVGMEKREDHDDLRSVLHEEVERLPERYQSAVVLCDLEGRTHEQAARHLGLPVGTVKSRQSRGRERLRDRLARRGHAPVAVVAAMRAGPIDAMVPPALTDATARAAIQFSSTRAVPAGAAAILAREVIRSMSISPWSKAATILLALGATVSGAAALAPGRGGKPSGDDPTVVAVEPVKLKATLTERGVLEAGRTRDGVNVVDGQSVIRSIVPEGSMVKKGDLVCELDSSALKDRLITQEIAAKGADDALRTAKLAAESARGAVKEYVEGTADLEAKALEGAIAGAEASLGEAAQRRDRAHMAKARLARLFEEKGPTNLTSADILAELEIGDRIGQAEEDIEQAKRDRELAQGRLSVLKDITRKRVTEELTAALRRAEAGQLAVEAAFRLEESKAAKIRKQIEQCKITAPIDGLVVYAGGPGPVQVENPGNRPPTRRFMIEEGAVVRERQKIFSVVDLDGPMRVNAKVRESLVDRVPIGSPVKIAVDAMPGREFVGEVKRVNPTPDPPSLMEDMMRGRRKLYTTIVEFAEGSPQLRPGMTAQVDLAVGEINGVLAVPKGSVVERDGKPFVAVKAADGSFSWREVVLLGVGDDGRVAIERGLKPGELVAEKPETVRPPDKLPDPASPKGEPPR